MLTADDRKPLRTSMLCQLYSNLRRQCPDHWVIRWLRHARLKQWFDDNRCHFHRWDNSDRGDRVGNVWRDGVYVGDVDVGCLRRQWQDHLVHPEWECGWSG